MSKTDFENIIGELKAISEKEVKSPSIPVSAYIQEAEDLKIWTEEDREELIGHGLNWSFVESLPERAGACREAQSIWVKEQKSRENAEKEWFEKSPDAFKLRDSLLSAFRYAFRKDENLLANVALIAEGASREDMIQDLNDIAVLGRENTDLLTAIKFDLEKLELAAETADYMAELLAGAKSEKGSSPKELDMRNRAYTYLKQAVDEVRDCGKYTFSDNEERLKGYRSEFLRKYRNKSKNNSNEE